MITNIQKSQIIDMKRRGNSTREIARKTGLNRETVAKYWSQAQQKLHELEQRGEDSRTMQQEMYSEPQYKERESKQRKITPETIARLTELCEEDRLSRKKLGWDKQRLTNIQIHSMLLDEGHIISQSSVNAELSRLRKPHKNPTAYIKQYYEYGKRLEFDFGEVKLDLGDGFKSYHMAVFSAPASNFRWCFLYDNEKQKVFLDSHVRFFKMVGGVWETVVYDNMRNVVSKFEGKNGKKLNDELQKLASYYGYTISTTNAYSGNEKGHVEGSMRVLRNRLFSVNQKFESIEAVRKYMKAQLMQINKDSGIIIERDYLKAAPSPYELAEFAEGIVSKYSFVSIDGNRYSVPENYVGKRVSVKKYYDEIRIFFDLQEIARHKRATAKDEDVVNIMHFLKTLERKPAAVKNSVAIKAIPQLKELFEQYYNDTPRKFIEILRSCENVDEAIAKIKSKIKKKEVHAKSVTTASLSTELKTKAMLEDYSILGRLQS